ncbi:uncharacterized protein LOC118201692 [Stegodyphus dumicola]|uniref:uncharacterized protein LOC118201692 n=1 Tax=Stegodyphus dumicola TaxID=202533 RepID=UPI0015AE1179|nr:uncharacterized protein LOC118201692 [Stegodyphus dumicola]
MVQRQLNNLRRTVPESENDRQFYRQQMSELSNELQDLGSTLEKMERNAYYARRRMLRHYGTDFGSTGALHLSSSHPAIYSSSETLSQSSGRNSLKKKVYHMMSSPTEKLRKRHLFGELRAVASLSSLNIKSTSHASCEDVNISKDAKPWKGPFKFLGNLMDSRIRRKLWGSTKRIKSEDNILEEKKASSSLDISKDCNGFNTSGTEDNLSSSSSSESSDEEEVEESEKWVSTVPAKHVWKAPVVRKVASSQRAQIDPAILAEIEDFEKMAAQYISQHS